MSQAVCHRLKQMVVGRSNVWRVQRVRLELPFQRFQVGLHRFCNIGPTVDKLQNRRLSTSTRTELNLMSLRRFEIACWVTPNDSANSSCVWHEFCLQFGIFENFLFSTAMSVLDIKIIALEALKPLTTRSFTKSSLSTSTWEHSMSLSRSFLQVKAKNQNFPQMTGIRLENWHLRSRINLWCKYKFTNVVLSLCWQMSKLTVWHFWSVYFDQHLPLQPSIENGGSKVLLLIYQEWLWIKGHN